MFTDALEREHLMDQVMARLDNPAGRPLADPATDDPARPILLAVSDSTDRR